MRFPLLPALLLLALNIGVDVCLYRIIRSSNANRFWARIQKWSAVILAILILVLACLPKRSGSDESLVTIMWVLFTYVSIYVPKYIFLIFRAIGSLPLIWHADRWRWTSIVGLFVAIVSFVAIWWGALVDRLNIDVREVTVDITDLPADFDGFTIAQISDLHVGTFGHDTTFVSRLVDSINSLHPDLIVFTGDIVNRRSEEFIPFISTMRRLHAPYGVYSVMGNHDYGDYSDWPSM
ncbi:MAG: metallophosphoesterase, partial [Muribaculaceae bacterium]|nr:metallophosphoesterase [Muribaculaceae bacterium]